MRTLIASMLAAPLFTAASSTTILAQSPLSVQVTAASDMVVEAGANRQTTPAGTLLTDGWQIGVRDRAGACLVGADSSLEIGSNSVRFVNAATSDVPLFGNCGLTARAGRHSILVQLTPPQPGWFEVFVRSTTLGGGIVAGDFSVDLDADGSVELSGTSGSHFQWQARRVNATGMRVRIEVERLWDRFRLPSDVRQIVEVGLRDAGFERLEPIGSPCGGASLVVTNTRIDPPESLELEASSPLAHAPAFLVFGVSGQRLRIPPLGCELLTELLVPVPVAPDANGIVRARLDIPEVPLALDLRMQYLVADVSGPFAIWRTSNAVALDRF